jgi:uridine kinase
MTDLSATVTAIRAARRHVAASESALVALSGIDGSGKGYLADLLTTALRQTEVNAIAVNVDGWLNLPRRRFNDGHPAEHFYHHAIRFEALFDQLVLPLKRTRSIHVEVDFVSETATEYKRHTYDYQDVDVIVLEGVYLLKRAFRGYYDWAVWVDCSFETALERALSRNQEGLSAAETIRAYQTIYFPAQQIHFARDAPQSSADEIVINDPRIAPG